MRLLGNWQKLLINSVRPSDLGSVQEFRCQIVSFGQSKRKNGPGPWCWGRGRDLLACLQRSRAPPCCPAQPPAVIARGSLFLPYARQKKNPKVFVKALSERDTSSPAPGTRPCSSAPWFGLNIAPSEVRASSATRGSE